MGQPGMYAWAGAIVEISRNAALPAATQSQIGRYFEQSGRVSLSVVPK
jgi:hypothetical protein